jgi:hypothetical protein
MARIRGNRAPLRKNRKENLNRIRGRQRIIDPERGPSNK